MADRPPTLLLAAGEPSGDALGAQLMAALRQLGPRGLRIVGLGGPAMQAQGLTSIFSIDDIAVMGIREVVPRMPRIFARIAQTADFALDVRPDACVLIDSGDFNHRVARRIKAAAPELKVIKYVSPQVWASRPGRAAGMRTYLDHVLCLLPFEPAFYEPYGLPATFVGHPAVERAALAQGGAALRARLGIAADAELLCVLPGSRRSEIRYMLPAFRETVARLARDIAGLTCVLPTVPTVSAMVRQAARDWPTPLHVVEGEADRFAAFDAADLALATSGTVTTELAVSGCPMIAAYRVGWLTAAIWTRLVSVPHFTIANLVLGRRAIPEFRQDEVEPAAMAAAARPLLLDASAAAAQRRDLEEASRLLGKGQGSPASRAAEAVLEIAGLAPQTIT